MFVALARLLAPASATEQVFDRTSGAPNKCSGERVFDRDPDDHPAPCGKLIHNLWMDLWKTYPHPVEKLSPTCG
jgi:hypothetical protein